ncbi:hypothetical protein THAOC_23261, partial [Thalassiosira oceanica]
RDGCNARVLTVLDGATPPAKREAVRERSDRRKRAEERREADGDGWRPPRVAVSGPRGRGGQDRGRGPPAHLRVEAGGGRGRPNPPPGGDRPPPLRAQEKEVAVPGRAVRGGRSARVPREGGGVDLVVTEDSDLIGHGCPALCYKLDAPARAGDGGREAAPGEDGGACPPPGSAARCSSGRTSDPSSVCVVSLLRADLTILVLHLTRINRKRFQLKGIGIVTARDIVHGAFASRGGGGRGEEEDDGVPVLLAVLRGSVPVVPPRGTLRAATAGRPVEGGGQEGVRVDLPSRPGDVPPPRGLRPPPRGGSDIERRRPGRWGPIGRRPVLPEGRAAPHGARPVPGPRHGPDEADGGRGEAVRGGARQGRGRGGPRPEGAGPRRGDRGMARGGLSRGGRRRRATTTDGGGGGGRPTRTSRWARDPGGRQQRGGSGARRRAARGARRAAAAARGPGGARPAAA